MRFLEIFRPAALVPPGRASPYIVIILSCSGVDPVLSFGIIEIRSSLIFGHFLVIIGHFLVIIGHLCTNKLKKLEETKTPAANCRPHKARLRPTASHKKLVF